METVFSLGQIKFFSISNTPHRFFIEENVHSGSIIEVLELLPPPPLHDRPSSSGITQKHGAPSERKWAGNKEVDESTNTEHADQAAPLLHVDSLELLHAYPSRSRIDLIDVTMPWNTIKRRCYRIKRRGGKCAKDMRAVAGGKR